MQDKQIQYRADIDGLRAFAVLAVIGFHVSPNTIKGGFIGVDIFFVISGFLITSIILGDLNRNQFNLIDFYSRRIRRIFPALLLVMLSCFAFGWFALLAQEFSQLNKHIFSGSLFISNLVLWNETGYFDNFVDRKLLLNLWSLGVEEQFYLFWPLILSFGFKLKSNIGKLITAILIASFLWNLWVTSTDQSAAFYSPMTRFWELLVGSIAAYLLSSKAQAVKLDSFNSNIASILGFTLILLSVFLIDKQRAFPGWWATMPTIGAALIILAGENAFINKRLLGARISTSIGIISYPLYLWHWPILVYGNIMNGSTPSYPVRFGLIILTFALSMATYQFIEKPIRDSLNKKRITILLVALNLCMITISTVTYLQDGFVYREKNFTKISSAVDASDFPGNLKELKINGRSYGHGYQNSNIASTTLFIGDSNIAHYYPRINQLLNQKPNEANSVILLVQHGCLPIPNVYSDIHKCNALESMDILKANKNITTVVIGSRWFGQINGGYYYMVDGKKYPIENGSKGYQLALKSLSNFITPIKASGKKVYLLLSSPIGDEFDPRLMAQRSLMNFPNIISVHTNPVNLEDITARYGYIRKDLRDLANELGIQFIDPIDYLCEENSCPTISNEGEPMNSDPNHLNPHFVQKNAAFIDQTILTGDK